MPASSRFRLSALLAGAAVIAATVLPAFPALADDAPTPDPVVTSEATPTPDATADPTSDPTPDATPSEDPTPASTPSDEPTSTPSPTATTPAANTVSYAGTLNRVSDENPAAGRPTLVLSVPGQGYLLVDASALPQANRGGAINATFTVPAGLTLSSNDATRFTQLANYSTSVKPLVLLSTSAQRGAPKQTVGQLVTQTPVVNADHKVYVVLVSPKEKPTKTSDQTAAAAATLVAHADSYWDAQSSGSIGFTLAGTAAWYKSTYSCKTDAGSVALWNQAASVAKSKLGYVQSANTHLVLLFPGATNCGNAIGLGTIGWSVNQGGVLWVVGGDNVEIREATLAHELGHNLSLGHSDWLECSTASPNVGASQQFYDTPTTNSGINNCETNYYGDLVDVMGYGYDGHTGGSMSSAAGIRSGIWPSSAWVQAGTGTNNYTIKSVSGNTGLRAVIVQDPDGTNYFVEYREFTGADQQYDTETCLPQPGTTGGGDCTGDVANQAGVRVLRLAPSGFVDSNGTQTGYQGIPGYDEYLIGRTVGGVDKVRYLTGDSFYTQGGVAGIKVTVSSIDTVNHQATIQVVRSTHANHASDVYVESTRYAETGFSGQFTGYHVGETLTAFLGDTWDAETNTYQWQRRFHGTVSWTNIASATASSYLLTSNDVGQDIQVVVTGSRPTQANVTATGALGFFQGQGDYIAVTQGVYLTTDPGTVVVDNSTGTVTAADSNFPASHTTFAYQWYRGSTAITGAAGTGPTYTLVAADANQLIKVRVTTTIPGYSNSVVRTSVARNLTIKPSNTAAALTITGTPMPGQMLSITNGLTYTGDGAALTPTGFTYQWLRAGVAIAGATASTYLVDSADYGKKLTVRVTATKAGWVSNTTTSATGPTINQLGTLVKTNDAFISSTGLLKTATASLDDVHATGQSTWFATSISYQWYRNGVAISGATTNKYTLSQTADYGKAIILKVTYKRTGYSSYLEQAVGTSDGLGNYWIRANPVLPQIVGNAAIGSHLTVAPRTYFNMANGSSIGSGLTPTYQWYRSGVAISAATGGTADDYQVAAADKGKVITVKVTVTGAGYEYNLPSIATSAATPVVGTDLLPGSDAMAPTLIVNTAASTPFATIIGFTSAAGDGLTGITSPNATANVVKYQWLRDGAAIAGATAKTYALAQADRGHLIGIRITTSHVANGTHTYTTDTRYSNEHDYTLTTSGAGGIDTIGGAAFAVGSQVDAGLPNPLDSDGAFIPGTTRTKQWYRSGVAIPAAQGGVNLNNTPYLLIAADAGKTITVKMTVGAVGFIPETRSFTTTPATAVVATSTLMGAGVAGTVTVNDPATNELIANPPAVTAVDGTTSATFAYQWLRDGANIAGATTQKYKLVAADWDKDVSVRITASLPGYVPNSNVTVGIDYSITPKTGHEPYDSSSNWSIGGQAVVYLYDTFTTKDGDFTDGTVTFQWQRAGVAIPGATSDNYVIQAADYNKAVRAVVTVKKPGYVTLVLPLTTVVIGKGVTYGVDTVDTAPTAVAIQGPLNGVLTATTNNLYPANPAPVLTYKWYRGVTAIPGATAKTYKLVAADFGKPIGVKITVTRTNFVTPVFTLTSGYSDHSIYPGVGLPQITGTTAVGEELAATPSDFYDDAAKTFAASGIDYVFTWYRSGVAIAGATAPFYTLTSADVGKKITVKTTAVGPGRLAATGPLSAATNTVLIGTIVPGSYQAVVTLTGTTTKTAKVTFEGVLTTPASVTPTYKWLRNGVAISGATAASYKLTAADTGKLVTVQVTLTKSGFTSLPVPALTANAIVQGEPALVQVNGANVSTAHSSDSLTVIPPFYYLQDQYPGGTNLPGSALTFQWYSNGVLIPGATSVTYLPTTQVVGAVITVKIKVVGGAFYNTLTETSNAITID